MVDAHAHLTACAGFGGDMRCGTPFAPGGIRAALAPCDSHIGIRPGSLLEAIIGNTDPLSPDASGWPAFSAWPRHNTLLHEQAYYQGIERAWRAGLRVVNTLLVSNRVITELYDAGRPCDEMDEIRAQARFIVDMQDYIDSLHGGPGQGWFRIARTPADIRSIAAQGKLAVVLGTENSELFGGRAIGDVARITTSDVDAGLDEMVALGICNLFPVHKFDNAFGGVRFDTGLNGAAVNVGNLLSTGHWWEVEAAVDGPPDNHQPLADDSIARLLSGGHSEIPAGAVAPVYPAGPIRNVRGLTDLGRYLIEGMMRRGMIINVDHMSAKTATAVLDIAEAAGYAGVMSAHSWSDRSVLERTLALGGFAAGYANAACCQGGNRPTYVAEWQANRCGASGSALAGYGFGSDVNGFGPQAAPRLDAATHPLPYPFTAPNGTRFDRMRMGERTFDLNTDGVAQYGLYADWYADVVQVAGDAGPQLQQDMLNGAEAFVAMWEAARAWN
ncbi:hypothetical protein EBN03_05680 [Nocardia stercoris]|uniref:Peptidase M19 n=2 Tax=Nocardia stercoris TaxID=2483361 RepID=A0A3M2L9Y9_9NOCA|nr:hypothetical protein EBN03_05680 [Nocardia stercoris]